MNNNEYFYKRSYQHSCQCDNRFNCPQEIFFDNTSFSDDWIEDFHDCSRNDFDSRRQNRCNHMNRCNGWENNRCNDWGNRCNNCRRRCCFNFFRCC